MTAPYTLTRPCPFCEIIKGNADATVVRRWPDNIAIVPLRPVTPGHTLVIPHRHVVDAAADPAVSAAAMAAASELAAGLPAANIITSIGAAATQTIWHFHMHVVPRRKRDGLPLPWSVQHSAR